MSILEAFPTAELAHSQRPQMGLGVLAVNKSSLCHLTIAKLLHNEVQPEAIDGRIAKSPWKFSQIHRWSLKNKIEDKLHPAYLISKQDQIIKMVSICELIFKFACVFKQDT